MSQFIDAIIFVEKFPELVAYLDTHAPEALARDEDGNITMSPNVIAFARTPAVVNGDRLLAYCRFTQEQAEKWRGTPGVLVLAEAPYTGKGTGNIVYATLFADAEATAKYDSVYDRTPRIVDDGEGGTMEITPPFKFGMLAESQLPVPKSVTSRQGMQQLIIAGLDEQVESAIDGISDVTERKLTQAWFQRATEWERDNPQFISMVRALGLTDQQADDHTRAAALL